MVDALTDHLIILLNTVHSIRCNVFNEIARFNSKSLYRKSDEALINLSIAGSKLDKLMNDTEKATEVNFVVNKNDEQNLLHQKKIFEETQNFPGTKENNVLRTLKLKLEDSLRFVDVLRKNVTEQITIVNNERNSLQSEENNEIKSESKVNINKSPTKENIELKTTLSNDESDSSAIVKNEPLETFGKNNEYVMISLISDDDDSDSDCIEISMTDTNSDCINPDPFVPIKLENISNFQNNYTKRTVSPKINENVTEEQSNKRKLDEHEKAAKKKKKSRDKGAGLVNLFGELHKVKLSNLSAGITYEEIASLLKNSGLEFLDILLIAGGGKNVAEISFADIKMKEKALSLDPPLFHGGMKIRIKSL
ncbi:hypothetical protein O3M35_001212 [Rhynocoris fuscipes]|uniref:Uncharacterized protein n=1 Tax=Rhynocoris fuscipes TaxID=488301 RepID=A0AAW1DRU0_9HEMI